MRGIPKKMFGKEFKSRISARHRGMEIRYKTVKSEYIFVKKLTFWKIKFSITRQPNSTIENYCFDNPKSYLRVVRKAKQ